MHNAIAGNAGIINKFRLKKAIWLAGIIIVLALPYWVNPDDAPFSVCAFKNLTGLPCPACGISHSLHAAARFDFSASVKYHPAGLVIYVIAAFLLLKNILELIINRNMKINPFFIKPGIIALLTFCLGIWILRLIFFP